jgi:hypothetical protein
MGARMRAAGARHLLVTAVEKDGTGTGPDHAVLAQALAAFGPGVIASGGIGSVDDVARLAPLVAQGLAGVVVGSLLVDGRATADDLLRAAAGFDAGAELRGVTGAEAIGHRAPGTGHRKDAGGQDEVASRSPEPGARTQSGWEGE